MRYTDIVRYLWYTSYFGLFALALIAAFVKNNACCSEPSRTEKGCCTRHYQWEFVTLKPLMRDNDFVLFALGFMAILAAALQSIVFLFMRVNIITIYLLIAYNFVNWGWILSIWTGRFFRGCQAFCVGVGVFIMWAAAFHETALWLSNKGEEDTGVSLSILWVLAICSTVDFVFYVIGPYCCATPITDDGLKDTMIETNESTQAESTEMVMMYTIDDSASNDITQNLVP